MRKECHKLYNYHQIGMTVKLKMKWFSKILTLILKLCKSHKNNHRKHKRKEYNGEKLLLLLVNKILMHLYKCQQLWQGLNNPEIKNLMKPKDSNPFLKVSQTLSKMRIIEFKKSWLLLILFPWKKITILLAQLMAISFMWQSIISLQLTKSLLTNPTWLDHIHRTINSVFKEILGRENINPKRIFSHMILHSSLLMIWN